MPQIHTRETAEPGARPSARESTADLDDFVGKWKTVGTQHASDFGGPAEIEAIETYDWLEGRRFLIHRLDGRLGDAPMACIEIIERVRNGEGHRAQTFYNDGRSNEWQLAPDDDGWTLSGAWDHDGEAARVRCLMTLESGGDVRVGRWQRQVAGGQWETLWDVRSTRVREEEEEEDAEEMTTHGGGEGLFAEEHESGAV